MRKTVVFVEKRNFAKVLADGLGQIIGNETSSYFEIEASSIFPNGAIFTWGNAVLFQLGILITVERIPKENVTLIQKEKKLYHTTLASYYWNSNMPLTLDLLKNAYAKHYEYMFAEEHLLNVVDLLSEADNVLHVYDGDSISAEMFNLLCSLIIETTNKNFDEHIEEITFYSLESEHLKERFNNQDNFSLKKQYGLKDSAFEKSLQFLKVILNK